MLEKPHNFGRVAKREGVYHRLPNFTKATLGKQRSGGDRVGKARAFPVITNKRLSLPPKFLL